MKPADLIRFVTLAAIWGASFLFMRIIAPVIGGLPTAFIRVALAAVGLAAMLAVMRVRWDFKGKFPATLVLGVVSAGFPFVMWGYAARVLPAGYSAIFNATTPLMGALIGALFFSERLTGAKLMGVLLGIAGVVVLTRTGPVVFDSNVLLGAGACLVATTCYGLAGFLTRRWITERGGLDSKLLAFGSQVGSTLLLLPVFAWQASTQPPASWGGSTVWLALAGLGLVCTALAYILYFRLIADIGPVRAYAVTFLIPPFGVLWGALFLGEQLSWAHAAGGALIGAAVWMVLKPAAPTPAAETTTGQLAVGRK